MQKLIEQIFANQDNSEITANASDAINNVIADLCNGKLRVAEFINGSWQVHQWLKQAILLYFRINQNQLINGSCTKYFDKVPLKFTNYTAADFQNIKTRVVPPAHIRTGVYVGKNTILMPSYINIGAYIDDGSMIDIWATIGSCAQIGKNVHISSNAVIGGVLEPLQANPTIIEDNCFIGASSTILEGVIVEKNSVIATGVHISQSTKIYDRTTGHIHYGKIPTGSVVVPGSLPAADGSHSIACAIIVKTVDDSTRAKVAINELLRS